MVKATDPNGVEWSVDRAWYFDMSGNWTDGGGGDILGILLFYFVVLPLFLIAFWPFWFLAHWLGLAWVIDIERDGKQVGEEKLRGGWGKSQRRIQEIAESAAAGTIKQQSASWAHVHFPDVPVTDESATPGEPTRCVLHPIAAFGRWDRPTPNLAIDVGKDTIWVIDLNTNALIASAWPAQVTATPAKHQSAGAVLVVGVPGLPTPMTVRPPNQIQRTSWRGEVVKTRGPVYLVAKDEEWLTLVEKFGLTPYLG